MGQTERKVSKAMMTVTGLFRSADPALNLAFQILEYVLLGMPGSSPEKALTMPAWRDLGRYGVETGVAPAFPLPPASRDQG